MPAPPLPAKLGKAVPRINISPKRDGKNVQMQVKEGDRVIFSKYAGTEIKVDEEEYTIVSQKDIIAIVE